MKQPEAIMCKKSVKRVEKNGSPPSVLVIVAALNEEEGVGPSLMELSGVLKNPRCLIVDGKSSDGTVRIGKDLGAEILLQEGFGKGDAVAQAIKHINSDEIKYIVFTDADFSYPAGYLPEMVRILEENPEVGMVTGNRFNPSLGLSTMNNLFYAGNRFLAFAQHLLNGVDLVDPLTGLRVVRWRILKNWEPRSKGFDIEAEVNHRVERLGYKTVEIPIKYRSRLGQKKLKLRHGLSIIKRIVTESL